MFKYIIIGLVCLPVVFSSCKKNKVQPQMAVLNEGCSCAKEVSADFLMEEMSDYNLDLAKYTNTDTIWDNKSVRFTALEENAEYTWYLGSEIIHSKSFMRNFSDLLGQKIPVVLVVKKVPNVLCLPNDDGYDSIVKHLIISTKTSYSDTSYLLEGVFRLKDPNMNDSVDITVDFRHCTTYSFLLDVFNYDGQGTNSLDYNALIPEQWGNSNDLEACNYRQIWFTMNAHTATLSHKLNGEITLNIIANSTSFPSFHYKGRKL